VVNAQHALLANNTLEKYLESDHIWVSKTGIGVATGMSQENSHKRGWIDDALTELNCERKIRVFTRHYQIVPLLVNRTDLIATLPTRAARSYSSYSDLVIVDPPFTIKPIEINMVWSPLLHHSSAHQWIRRTLVELAKNDTSEE
jgi:DNA-binding transcriptional LysR family regulator